MLKYLNYYYTVHYAKNGIEYWRCRLRSCSGRLKIQKEIVTVTTEHNGHELTAIDHEVANCDHELRNITPNAGIWHPSTIVSEVLQKLSLESRPSMSSDAALKNRLARIKRKRYPESIPTTREEINIPEHLKLDFRGKMFLLFDSGDNDRTLIFATELLDLIKKEQDRTYLSKENLIAGSQPRKPRAKYMNLNSRLKSLVQRYHKSSYDVNEYLTGLAHNMTEFRDRTFRSAGEQEDNVNPSKKQKLCD